MDTVRGRAIARQHSRDLDIGAATLDAIRLLAEERSGFLRRAMELLCDGRSGSTCSARWIGWCTIGRAGPPRCRCPPSASRGMSAATARTCTAGTPATACSTSTTSPILTTTPTSSGRRSIPTGCPERPSTRGDARTSDADRARAPARSWRRTGSPAGRSSTGGFGTADLDLHGEGSTLRARKRWHFLDDAVVALGTEISASDGRRIETIVENRNLRSDAGRRFVVDGVVQAPGSESSGDITACSGRIWRASAAMCSPAARI